jgi:tape measure domain-containing protein
MAKKIEVLLELDTTDFDRGVKKVKAGINNVEKESNSLTNTFKGLKTAVGAFAAGAAIKQMYDFANAAQEVQNKLSIVTDGTDDLNNTFDQLVGVATNARVGLDGVAELYQKLNLATQDMNVSQSELVTVTETFSKMLTLAGTSTQGAEGAIRQLGQALASGAFRGDEFNSVVEAAPQILDLLAQQTGVTRGEVRALAADGKLTADVLINALAGGAEQVNEDFAKMAPTVGQALTNLQTRFISLSTSATPAMEAIANTILMLSENLDVIVPTVASFAAVWATVKIASVTQQAIALIPVLKTLFAMIAANPIGLIITAVGALVALFYNLYESTGSVGNAFATMGNMGIEVANRLLGAFSAVGTMITGLGDAIGGSLYTLITGGADEAMEALKDSLSNAWEEAQDAFSENTITYSFEIDEDAKARAQEAGEQVAQTVRDTTAEIENQTDAMKQADTERQKLHDRDMSRAEALLERFNDKNNNLEREVEILQAIEGMTEAEARLKKELMKIEFNRRDALKEIEGMLVSDAERNELTEKLNKLTQEQIDLEKKRHAENMDHKSKEAKTNEENNKKRREIEQETSDLIKDMNTQTYNSMENAFVDFVSTGKLEFKDLVDEMLDQLKRLVAKQIFKQILGIFGGGFGAGISKIFDFFDTGGVIPSGKFGIVGEKGPEIVSGPAKVIGRKDTERMLDKAGKDRNTGGGANITYNISAVDAQSFKELVASDPEFIYNVTQAGARLQPI